MGRSGPSPYDVLRVRCPARPSILGCCKHVGHDASRKARDKERKQGPGAAQSRTRSDAVTQKVHDEADHGHTCARS